MTAITLLIGACVIIACILLNKISTKLGVPVLLAFIGIGMLFGSDGILKIPFDNYKVAEQVCSIALIFIMFYGGFGTNWNHAKSVAGKAIGLSTLGVILTAAFTGLFCNLVLRFGLLESFLIGSVLSCTDAASVFSILRSKKLNLKNGSASILEIESGSNDPCAYMLVIIILSIMNGQSSLGSLSYLIFAQIFFGTILAVIIAYLALYMLRHFPFTTEGFDAAFVLAIALLSFALPTLLDGNGYLSAYIVGIILGNQKFHNKKALVHFLDGITGLMQMLIFFLLGLLAFPSQFPMILLSSIVIALFLTFLARPLAVFIVLAPAKFSFKQKLLISWSGLRGASSIVFAIMVTVNQAHTENDVYHVVFFIVLLSIGFQGTLLPLVANKLNMIDNDSNVLKTFNDYVEESEVQFIRLLLEKKHPWINQPIKDILLPPETLLAMLIREDKIIIPKGNTTILDGDLVILSAPSFHDKHNIQLSEIQITQEDAWIGKPINAISMPAKALIIMIKRNGRVIIPNGNTKIKQNDVLVINSAAFLQ